MGAVFANPATHSAGDIQAEISMKYFLLLSLMLALLLGQEFPSQNSDHLPDYETVGAELEVLPTGDSGLRLALDSDDPSCCDHADFILPDFRPLSATYHTSSILNSTTTPYSIRAPPVSTTA